MKKFGIWLLALVITAGIGAYVFYKFYLPGLVAKELVKDEESVYVPRFVKAKIRKYKAPVNKGAHDVIKEMHKSNVTLEQLLQAIDETEEEQVRGMLAELNQINLKSTDQVFDVAKKHFTPGFDIEILRKPFNDNVSLDMVKNGLKQANSYASQADLDPEMAKAVAKQILIQKEKEYNRIIQVQE
jgi:hypothetical protein